MSKIFISYAQDGQEIASELKASLESGGQHTVFLHASDNPEAEKSADSAIKACDLFVTLVTENSHDSKFAYSHFKLAENARKAILPIKIDSGLPPHLLAYDAIELKGLDVTPVSREIELLVLTNARQNDQRTLRAVMITIALIALVFIGYTFLFPEIEAWYIVNFVPTDTPISTRTPSPTPSPIPTFYPVEGGGELVFIRTTDGITADIFLLDLSTGEETQLTDNPANDSSPVWSPDGLQIVFNSNRDGDYEIYLMDSDGSNLRQLTNNDTDDYQASWSPDASQIVFAAERDGRSFPDIYVMDSNGENETRLTDNPFGDFSPDWSPNGTKIAFTSERDDGSAIFLMDIDGTNQERLTSANVFVKWGGAWSPDGSQIVFLVEALGVGNEIYSINADGTNQQRLTDISESYVNSPVWSSHGSQIIFSQRRGRNNEDIFIMNADGSDIRPVTNSAEDERGVQWRPQSP